jgi:hypothetical protein
MRTDERDVDGVHFSGLSVGSSEGRIWQRHNLFGLHLPLNGIIGVPLTPSVITWPSA